MRYLFVFLCLTTTGCHILLEPLHNTIYIGLPGSQIEITEQSNTSDIHNDEIEKIEAKDDNVGSTIVGYQDSASNE